jgi:nicotinamidase-related amidase
MHKNAFTPDNAAMLLIDHQLGTMAWTHSGDINLVKHNALRLARIAKAVGLPVLLTARMEDQVQGSLVPELEQSCRKRLPSVSGGRALSNTMHHEGFSKAVKTTGRKKPFVAGVTTEICVTFPVLQMLEEVYEVQASADASASWSKYGNELAFRRMEQAGAVITTVDQIISELAIDWTSPNGKKLEAILDYR